MKKVLLIGKLSDIVRSINEIMDGDFNVQICTLQLDNVMGMVKIVKPELIVMSLIGADNLDLSIFGWLSQYASDIPIIVVTSRDSWDVVKVKCDRHHFTPFYPPINKDLLLDACFDALKPKKQAAEGVEDGRKKVLVIDDNAAVLRNIKSMLAEQYNVTIANSGEMGIEKALSLHPDIVLMDYEMPGLDGKRTYETMLQLDDIKDIPVVFLTSVSDRERILAVVEIHPAAYVLKPPDKDKLILQIEEVFEKMN